MKHRLIRAAELRRMVFGEPSVQLGDTTISIKEVSRAIFENGELRKLLSDTAYTKIKADAATARADFANYGCYGTGNDIEFFAIEVYKFVNADKPGEYLFIVIAKPFTAEFLDGDEADDVVVDYTGKVMSTWFMGSYTMMMNKNVIEINDKSVQLIKNIPANTTPEKFYTMYAHGEFRGSFSVC